MREIESISTAVMQCDKALKKSVCSVGLKVQYRGPGTVGTQMSAAAGRGSGNCSCRHSGELCMSFSTVASARDVVRMHAGPMRKGLLKRKHSLQT